MKISEIIEKLCQLQEEHGDKEVYYLDRLTGVASAREVILENRPMPTRGPYPSLQWTDIIVIK